MKYQGRYKDMKKILLVIFLLFALIQSNGLSQVTKTGTSAAKFLSIGIGPRANAMGGAFTSVANDASALYWNPAGAAALTDYEAMFTYTSLFKDLDINLNYTALVIPAGNLGNFGVSVTALDYGDMDVTTELYPEGTGEKFSASSYAFALSYARNITESFSAGITIKYIREKIFNSSADGVAFDVGTIFNTPFWGVKFSSIITNYGSKLQISGEDLLIRHDIDPTRKGNNESVDAYYKTDKFELPLKLQIGLSRNFQLFENQRLTITVDAAHPNDNAEYINIGGELALFDNMFYLRGGYKALFLKDSQEGLTLGVGLNYTLGILSIQMDYAFQEYDFLGNTHSFGVLLKF
jgi:hypothetical protein